MNINVNVNQFNLLCRIENYSAAQFESRCFITGLRNFFRNSRIIFILGLLLIITACSNKLPIERNFSKINYQLVDHEGSPVNFINDFKGKTIVAGYIFTNCPDICPLTTNNMRLVQESLSEDEMKNVQFISISFDPEVDTPETLAKFTDIRNLDLTNWKFLTGSKSAIDSLMKDVGVIAILSDSTVTADGEVINYFAHTDRISLIDRDLKLRKNYLGSEADIEEIVSDINSLN